MYKMQKGSNDWLTLILKLKVGSYIIIKKVKVIAVGEIKDFCQGI